MIAVARLAWGLQRTVHLLRHVYVGIGRPSSELAEIETALGRSLMPEEYVEIVRRIAGLSAPTELTPTPLGETLASFRRSLATVARSVLAEGVATELEALSRRYDVEGDTDPGPLLQAVTRLAAAVARSRESSDVLNDALSHVQKGIRRIADEEESAQTRVRQSRERIAAAGEVGDLDAVRAELLEQASHIEGLIAERRSALELLEKQSRSARRRAARLVAALADATTAAATDVLTGLGNRRALERAVEARVADRDGAGVLVMDIDHFKRVNDTYGHGVGDRVLVHVAELLQQELRGDDQGFRVGGEEFIVLLQDCDLNGAVRTAERVRQRIEKTPAAVLGRTIALTTSLGVGLWDGATHFEETVNQVDAALYEAKRAGRNRCVVASAPVRGDG
jgi:diguanylate cyclase (GGDEF)-like protein